MQYRIFDPAMTAEFSQRQNRFVITCRLADGTSTQASMAYPGRLWELLSPGVSLALEPGPLGGALPWKAVAVRYRQEWLPLVAARSNQAAQTLVLPQLFANKLIKPEYKVDKHRFDFAILDAKYPQAQCIEVKSCSLIEGNLALFPDAPSARATSHIQTLAALAPSPMGKHRIIWLVWDAQATAFMPNPHTDPDFAAACLASRDILDWQAISLKVDAMGWAQVVNPNLAIQWQALEDLNNDRGAYCFGFELAQGFSGYVGALGSVQLAPGWYVYVGSAMQGLSARLKHHSDRAKRGAKGLSLKPAHWHLDYLSASMGQTIPYPIRSTIPLEDHLAAALASTPGAIAIPGFGASDRPGKSHLFHVPAEPHRYRPFLDILNQARHRWCMGSLV